MSWSWLLLMLMDSLSHWREKTPQVSPGWWCYHRVLHLQTAPELRPSFVQRWGESSKRGPLQCWAGAAGHFTALDSLAWEGLWYQGVGPGRVRAVVQGATWLVWGRQMSRYYWLSLETYDWKNGRCDYFLFQASKAISCLRCTDSKPPGLWVFSVL